MASLAGLRTAKYLYIADNGKTWSFVAVEQIAAQANFTPANSTAVPVEQAPFKPRKVRLQSMAGVIEIVVPTVANPLWVQPVQMNLDGVIYTKWLQFPEHPSSANVLETSLHLAPIAPITATPQKPAAGFFTYIDDGGKYWRYREYNAVADQLNLFPAWAALPLLSNGRFFARKIKYVDPTRGFVMYVIVPWHNGVVWTTPPPIGLSGYLYQATQKYAEFPTQGLLTQ
jgi:hypothetical protein